MPIYLEPGHTFPVRLKSDEGKSPLPTFHVLTQSMRGQREIAAVLDKLTEAEVTTPELFDATTAQIERVVARTENMPEFKADLLSYAEARELLTMAMYNQQLDHDSKKD